MTLEFEGPIWYWRGPAPFYFVTVPEEEAKRIKDVSTSATYGWGMIPVDARIGETEWYTALFPKESLYVVPIKAAIRKAERLEEGQLVRVRLSLKFREFDPFESKFS